jgi:hypothetical protein
MKHFLAHTFRFQVALFTALSATATMVQAAVAPSVSLLGPLAAGVDAPTRVAFDGSGNVYVVDSTAGRVVLVDAFNRVLSEKTGLRSPLGIAADAGGNLYLGEAKAGCVTVFDSQWKPLSQLGVGDGEFQLPSYIAIDSGTTPVTVYVSDSPANELKVYRSGVRVGTLGGPGSTPTGLDFPAGVWVNGAGDVFAADQNNQRVLVYSRDGAFVRAFLLGPWGTAGATGRPAGITGDAAGRIYVADTFQDYIKAFDEQGVLLATISGYGAAPGQVRSPAGIAMDPQGRLLLASPNTGRVEVFGLDCFTQLTATPASQAAPQGGTVTFSALPSCAGPVTFQWRKDTNDLADGGIVSGATNATLALAGVTPGDAGNYSVAMTGPDGTLVSPEAWLTITAPPAILTSPTNCTLPVGSSVVFSAAATGTNLVWRWFYNSLELFTLNTNTLVLTNLQLWATGKYWAVTTNSAGSATTAQATLTVLTPPYIIAGPTNQTVAERATASFTVQAGGSATLRYQWYFGQTALAGQTNATLVLTNATPPRNGTYYAQVSNTVGTTNGPAATLSVQADTVRPVALVASGGAATSRTILVSFSEAVSVASAQQPSKYELMGPGGLTVVSAVVTNTSKVLLTLSGNRNAAADYAVRIQDVTDTAYTPNLLSPNPTTLSVLNADSYGTVAWWPLDEGSGTFTRDATGNGRDGTLESATWTTGRSGYSVNLDGAAGDVVIPALNLYTNTVTISAWVRRNGSQPSSAGIFFTRAGNSVAGLRFGSANDLRYNWNNASAAYNFSSSLVPPDGQWAFAAVAVEPSRAILYLNTGTGLRSATNTTTHAIEEFNAISYLGWDQNSITRRFKGALDDVRVCNRALSATEIQGIYNATVTPATCAISSPQSGAVVASASPTILASVASNGNTISKVEFYSGGTLLGTARTAPYALVWSNLVSGAYSVQARAWFGPANYSATSSVVNFTVAIPITSTLTMLEGTLILQWSGGLPPYQVQVARNLVAPVWENAGPATTNTSTTLLPSSEAAFYRVVGH